MAMSLKDIKKHHATGRSLSLSHRRRFLLINVTKKRRKERNISEKSSDDRM
jgi:hypothetical protein